MLFPPKPFLTSQPAHGCYLEIEMVVYLQYCCISARKCIISCFSLDLPLYPFNYPKCPMVCYMETEMEVSMWKHWCQQFSVNLQGHTVPVKSLDTPAHSRVFLYLYYFLHCRIIAKTSNYEITHMESSSNQINVEQIKMYFIFEIHHRSHPSPWWQFCTLLAFSQPASWGSHLEWFSNIFEVPTYVEHLLAVFPSLCDPTHPEPCQWGAGRVIVEGKSSDAALNLSPSL